MFYTYYADTLVTLMLGWVRGFTDWIWRLISMGDGSSGRSFLRWFSDNWIMLVIVLIIIGIVIDWIVWLIRWRPYWLWFGKKRRILNDTDDYPQPNRSTNHKTENSVPSQRSDVPHFTSKALPRSHIAQPEAEYEEDDLFDVVSSSLQQNSEQTSNSKRLVGASVNQYITPPQNAKPDAVKKPEEIEWFD